MKQHRKGPLSREAADQLVSYLYLLIDQVQFSHYYLEEEAPITDEDLTAGEEPKEPSS